MFAYNFGLSQEDERTEAAALELRDGDAVLCIASAGEMPLSLLALGAGSVTAVDIDDAQLHLTALKLAAVRALDRDDALAFLGYLPASVTRRREALRAVLPLLDRDAHGFWSTHERVAWRGAIWQGRYERYIRRLVALATPAMGRHRLARLFEAATLDEQRAYFDREIGRPMIRTIFRVAFHPAVFGGRGMDPRSLRHHAHEISLGDQYFGRFRAFCTATPARENHHLQLTLLGRIIDPSATPACFSTEGIAALRARHARLRLVAADVTSHLAAEPPGTYRKIQLSNLADWLSAEEHDALLETIAARCARPGRAVFRYLHAKRDVPPSVRAVMRADLALGERLVASDRFPFYGVVPLVVGAP